MKYYERFDEHFLMFGQMILNILYLIQRNKQNNIILMMISTNRLHDGWVICNVFLPFDNNIVRFRTKKQIDYY